MSVLPITYSAAPLPFAIDEQTLVASLPVGFSDRDAFHASLEERGVELDPLKWIEHLMMVEAGVIERDYKRFPFVVVDGFAGAGGSSNGVMRALRALRVPVLLVQINHWDTAIATQVLNFPFAIHYNASVETPDPRSVIPWLHVDLAVFSPECVTFSQARGKKKKIREQSRSSAAYILTWLERVNVARFCLENVVEWRTQWGRLNKAGTATLKGFEGEYFRAFIRKLKKLNYPRVIDVELDACQYGSGTSRKRLFVMAKKGDKAVVPPPATHGPGLLPYRTARDVIDFLDLGESSFARYDRYGRAEAPHAINSLKRTRAGYTRQLEERPGAAAYAKAFDLFMPIAQVYHDSTPPTDKGLETANLDTANAWRIRYGLPESEDTLENRAAERTKILVFAATEWRQHYKLVAKDPKKPLTGSERSKIKAANVEWARWKTGQTFAEPIIHFRAADLVNALPESSIIRANAGQHSTYNDIATSVGKPLGSPTGTESKALSQPMFPEPMINGQHEGSIYRPVGAGPTPTVTADGALGLTQPQMEAILPEPSLLPQHNFGHDTVSDVDVRVPGITAISRHALTQAAMNRLADDHLVCVGHGKDDERQILTTEPLPSSTAKPNVGLSTPLAEAALLPMAHGPRHDGEEERTANINAPLGAQHAGGNAFALGTPMLEIVPPAGLTLAEAALLPMAHGERREGEERTLNIDAPLGAQPSSNMFGLGTPVVEIADPGISSIYGGFERGAEASPVSSDKPMPNISAQGGHLGIYQPRIAAIAEPSLVSKHYTWNENPSIDASLPTIDTRGVAYVNMPQIADASVLSRQSFGEDDRKAYSPDRPLLAATGDGAGYLSHPQIEAIAADLGADAFTFEKHGEREGQAPRVHHLDKPMRVIAGSHTESLVQPATGGIRDVWLKPKITIDGAVYVIDSLFRMLRVREIAKAMDFIDERRGYDFIFAGTESDATRQIGNAVAGNVMEANVHALCADVKGLPADVPLFDVVLGPYAEALRLGDTYGIYREKIVRMVEQKSSNALPSWFDAKENETHIGIHLPGGRAVFLELERNDRERATFHPYEIAITSQSDEPTALALFAEMDDAA
jgi:site-specific DNA-cytosine methylase